jgi:CRISPR/Cas system-associated endonuclease Cas1
MQAETSNIPGAHDIWDRIPRDQSVLIVDGQGISLNVSYGHLVIHDGLGPRRRLRRLTRAQRTIKHITVLGRSGAITFDAIRWCHDTGIALIQLNPDGQVLLTAGSGGTDNARLRRAQARADVTGVDRLLAAELIASKVDGQAALLTTRFAAERVADTLQQIRDQIDTADLVRLRELEAKAASYYFATWTRQLAIPFIERDVARIPDHWRTFTGRSSTLNYGRSPRRAADPLNALLNYAYALGEADLTLAIAAVGLDPGMGVLHVDQKNRASLTLDLIEPPTAGHRRRRPGASHTSTAPHRRPARNTPRSLPAPPTIDPRGRRTRRDLAAAGQPVG